MNNEKKPARVSMTKAALARVLCIDRQIASGKFPNVNYLVNYLLDNCGEASSATVSRDIAFMKDELRAPIEYNAAERGYYYTKSNYRIPLGFAGADELLALGMAKSILSLYRDTPIYNSASQLLDCITAPLAADGNWYENRIVVPQIPSSPIAPDAWSPITTALKENRILSFEYMGTYDDDHKLRRVRPYQLLFSSGLWYLYGFAEERKGIRLFSLCRMRNIVTTKDRFTLPPDFDYRTANPGSYFGVYSGQKKYRFKIAFYDTSVVWVKDRKWAEDQKIAETDDGVIVSFTSTQFDTVLEWVLSRGCAAQPLEPELLVNTWRTNIEEMLKMAGGK